MDSRSAFAGTWALLQILLSFLSWLIQPGLSMVSSTGTAVVLHALQLRPGLSLLTLLTSTAFSCAAGLHV